MSFAPIRIRGNVVDMIFLSKGVALVFREPFLHSGAPQVTRTILPFSGCMNDWISKYIIRSPVRSFAASLGTSKALQIT